MRFITCAKSFVLKDKLKYLQSTQNTIKNEVFLINITEEVGFLILKNYFH